MAEVGVRALGQNASAIVARAAAGEVITVTVRGRPVAQLSPTSSTVLDGLAVAGSGRTPKRSLDDLPLPADNGVSLSDEVISARAAERY